MSTRPYSLFSTIDKEFNPEPPKKENAKPFHVVIRQERWIPVSVLVFAKDADHAVERVRLAIIEMEKERRSKNENDVDGRFSRAQDVLKAFDSETAKNWQIEVSAFNTDLIAAKVNWASNGHLL